METMTRPDPAREGENVVAPGELTFIALYSGKWPTEMAASWWADMSDEQRGLYAAAERKARMSGELWEAVQRARNALHGDGYTDILNAITTLETAK